MIIGKGYEDGYLSEGEAREVVSQALDEHDLTGKRVLVIIPDHTRTAPISLFFRLFHELLWDKVAALDYLVALGTHQPMSEEALLRLVGITAEEHREQYAGVRIFNHEWQQPGCFRTIGTITAEEIAEITGGLMRRDVLVSLNKLIFDYDQLIICGPTFPHEVVGFSGGNKYFFPGIGGPGVIHFTHWLGAVMTSMEIIGTKHTPVRQVIDRAASCIDRPKLCFSLVVKEISEKCPTKLDRAEVGPVGSPACGLAGLFIGTPEEAWSAAADLSAKLHVIYVDRPFRRVLSIMPAMYDDLWLGAKGMYKLEPAIADGGEVVVYAPHITEVSYTHGEIIDQVGYHVRDYFLKQWDRFQDYPWCVLAHSTHLRGVGTFDAGTGIEKPRIRVTLATGIPEERCRRIGLGYLDPASVDPGEWEGREDEGILVVHKAGEMLYRVG
ncbi:MAG: lactate racemase domain-containing protein [Chloroflexota bacterium]|nr:lactate racemase domain-containing protein [Chloroflexota bacterium]